MANPSRSQNGTELQFKLSRDVDPKAAKSFGEVQRDQEGVGYGERRG